MKLIEGPDGSLYYVDIGFNDHHQPNPAAIRRIRYTLEQPPVAVAAGSPTTGLPPLAVAFSSAGSYDPEGATLSYAWSFGDGATSTEADPTHIYSAAGRYVARLTVFDGVSSTLSNDVVITVGTPPTATILGPADGSLYRAGDVINYSATATDAEDGDLPPSAFSWSIRSYHDGHIHPVDQVAGTTSGTLEIPTSGQVVNSYEILLTVTDSTGLTYSTAVMVLPETVNVTFDTVPSGLTLEVDGISRQTPFVLDDLIGFQHTINAPNQSSGGRSYNFVDWSDGGAQTHGIVAPENDFSYTATFDTPAPPSGPVAAYGFNAGSGAVLTDESGNGHTGTISGAAWNSGGRFGGALQFDGVNDSVTISDADDLDLTTGMTLEAWVNPSAITRKWRDVIYKGNDVYYLEASSTSGSLPVGGTTIDGQHVETFGTSVLAVNTWSHLAVTYDGAVLRLYLNGIEASNAARTGTVEPSVHPLQIGGDSIYGQFFAGLIDEIRIYNRALSIAEIQGDMNAPVGSLLSLSGDRATGTSAGTLTHDALQPLVNEAMARWIAALGDSDAIGSLQGLRVDVIDLPGTLLGIASSSVIWIDVDAAGHGWFLHSTPWDDSEFVTGLMQSPARGRVDLLTVVAHELGHVLGLNDILTDPLDGDVMGEALPLGVRRMYLGSSALRAQALAALWAQYGLDEF
ncbi:MAG: PKD domain-containing protein [Planctomycetes bacterium]|nr:PKD domain-containing protein [Planctomycetota bacterium]